MHAIAIECESSCRANIVLPIKCVSCGSEIGIMQIISQKSIVSYEFCGEILLWPNDSSCMSACVCACVLVCRQQFNWNKINSICPNLNSIADHLILIQQRDQFGSHLIWIDIVNKTFRHTYTRAHVSLPLSLSCDVFTRIHIYCVLWIAVCSNIWMRICVWYFFIKKDINYDWYSLCYFSHFFVTLHDFFYSALQSENVEEQ